MSRSVAVQLITSSIYIVKTDLPELFSVFTNLKRKMLRPVNFFFVSTWNIKYYAGVVHLLVAVVVAFVVVVVVYL